MITKKEKIKVNMTGDEYLRLLEFKKKNKFVWTKEGKIFALILSCASIFALTTILIVDMLTYTPSTYQYTWNGIGMFLAICMGLAWIIHGFGFILIRR